MLVIDRIEGEWAVISQDMLVFKIPLALMPVGVKENDVITMTVSKDEAAAHSRKKQMDQLAKDIFKE